MDWMANRDGIDFLMREVWPLVASARPKAEMLVVGRNPPQALINRADKNSWTFTGFVDDVRQHIRRGSVYVVPLRVGGGTRIKVYEAMAMGCPIVSTTIGVEGLPVIDGEHYIRADTPADFATALTSLLTNAEMRERLSRNARSLVQREFSAHRAAQVFESICLDTMDRVNPGGVDHQQTP